MPEAWEDLGPAGFAPVITFSAPGRPLLDEREIIPDWHFSGRILRTPKGVMHRAQADGAAHPRCRGGRGTDGWQEVDEAEAADWASRHPSSLCRYRWCFWAAVRSLGTNPEVGHVVRVKRVIA